jgi:SNF2 family DNA or RNA helicase
MSTESFVRVIRRSGLEYKEYQKEGVMWCVTNEVEGRNGGFIADDMGLGKTIMMIGLMYTNFVEKTLIIVPPILVDQWSSQIIRLTGHKCVVYHGSAKKHISEEYLRGAKIVVCTYNGIIADGPLHKIKWSRLIFDEAHHLRNKNTCIYKQARCLKGNIRWLVSGTPVQNSKKDFYALCSILRLPASYYTDPSNLRELARNYILKRTKKQVGIHIAELHKSQEVVEWKSEKEKELSEELHSALSFSGVNPMKIANSGLLMSLGRNVLPLMLRAKQSCIYPKMLLHRLDKLASIGQIGDYSSYREGLEYSSKLDAALSVIIERKSNGAGKLVFCHFREEIDEIELRLRSAGVSVVSLDGRTNSKQKSKILKDAYDVLILQIQTGCEGLNLQEHYSEIYFISPHWNPAVEDQAIARCHRIGQKKPVYVHRFQMSSFGVDGDVATRTIDKYVDDVQEGKRIVASEIIPHVNPHLNPRQFVEKV